MFVCNTTTVRRAGAFAAAEICVYWVWLLPLTTVVQCVLNDYHFWWKYADSQLRVSSLTRNDKTGVKFFETQRRITLQKLLRSRIEVRPTALPRPHALDSASATGSATPRHATRLAALARSWWRHRGSHDGHRSLLTWRCSKYSQLTWPMTLTHLTWLTITGKVFHGPYTCKKSRLVKKIKWE